MSYFIHGNNDQGKNQNTPNQVPSFQRYPPPMYLSYASQPYLPYPPPHPDFFRHPPSFPSSHFTFSDMPPPPPPPLPFHPYYPYSHPHFPPSSMPNLMQPFSQFEYEMGNNQQNQVKMRDYKKQIESAKKNGESNIVNQFFSYFSNKERSQKLIDNALKSIEDLNGKKQRLSHIFFKIMHLINGRRGRKYINRNIIINLFKPENLTEAVPQIMEVLKNSEDISVSDICLIFRKICWHFFRESTILAILSSKRISCLAKEHHLKKRRKILKALLQFEE